MEVLSIYEYTPLRPSADILAKIRQIEADIAQRMAYAHMALTIGQSTDNIVVDSPQGASPGNGAANQPGAFSFSPLEPALSYDAQVNKLVAHSLTIAESERDNVATHLEELNYYRLRGHSLMRQIDRIEIHMRSRMAHLMGMEYGPQAFEVKEAFKSGSRHIGMRRAIFQPHALLICLHITSQWLRPGSLTRNRMQSYVFGPH